ncbi:Fe-S cluster assembly protein SufD [Catalinimonas alkaloidigena]|uniref:Fe-S cluster assembly protein SufD n=1 Tax=Catalinimonas alkaloidigena TaxID=1075417 RepID=UPI002405484B|nr:Fe-S cluster assembly protein SufD [Catalinimonas alkaloidigena]MDF9795766.1 Fe-S cluster assembly protein SufD [Catalinimonas alkaloidigena]
MSQVTKSKKTDLTSAFIEQYSLSDKQSSNNALASLRQEAIESFAAKGLPAKKEEEYKYTPITRQLEKQFNSLDVTPSPTPKISAELEKQVKENLVDVEANHLVFVNGHFIESLSTNVSLSDGITLLTLQQAFEEQNEELSAYLGKQADVNSDPFIALNTAMIDDGVFLHVPKNKATEKPVITYFFSDASTDNVIAHPRNLFVVEENAQAQLIEIFHTFGKSSSYNNPVTEVVLKDAAHLHYCKYQNESDAAYHTGTTQILQAQNSHFHGTSISLKGAMIRNNINAVLDAEYCESHMYGLYMLDGQSHVDNHTSVDHKKPNAFSNELYKGIMDDQSKGVFNGKIFVRPNAQKTNAFQSNANILLTDEASIDTKPQLEIWADDVKCSHGATTGQLDAEQMFYLQTRGLSKTQARAVLLKAFAGDVIQHIKTDALLEVIEQEISKRLEKEL